MDGGGSGGDRHKVPLFWVVYILVLDKNNMLEIGVASRYFRIESAVRDSYFSNLMFL